MAAGKRKAVATASSPHTRSASENENSEAAANKAVLVILSSYPPDLAKDEEGARDYAKQLMRHVASYPPPVIARLADPVSGIVTRCRFPPSIADVVDFVKGLTFRTERPAHLKVLAREPEPWAIEALNRVATLPASAPLAWSGVRFVFRDDEAVLAFLDGLDVAEHRRAVGLTLARAGREAALAVIRAGMASRLVARETTQKLLGPQPQGREYRREPDREMCFVPPAPKFDISDLPDAQGGQGLSSSEWKDWAQRELGKQTDSRDGPAMPGAS